MIYISSKAKIKIYRLYSIKPFKNIGSRSVNMLLVQIHSQPKIGSTTFLLCILNIHAYTRFASEILEHISYVQLHVLHFLYPNVLFYKAGANYNPHELQLHAVFYFIFLDDYPTYTRIKCFYFNYIYNVSVAK